MPALWSESLIGMECGIAIGISLETIFTDVANK